MSKIITTEECIKNFQKIHGDKYDYSEVVYSGSNEKVKIICSIHGSFYQTPNKHLMGRGCPHCAGNVRKTTEQCINNFKKVHGDKYDYSLVQYKANNQKVKIVCPNYSQDDYDGEDEIITNKTHLLEIIKGQVATEGSTPS